MSKDVKKKVTWLERELAKQRKLPRDKHTKAAIACIERDLAVLRGIKER